jgi:RNA polymerase sigma-70 factor (ECF subfamily)
MRRKTLQTSVKNNEQTFAQLFHDHADAIYRFTFWRTGTQEQAQDMTSEVFTKAWEKWGSFTPDYPKAWLFMIAKNLLVDSYRKKSTVLLDEDAQLVDEQDMGEEVDKSLEAENLKECLGKLSEKSRQVLELRFMMGQSAREAAKTIDTTEENIRVLQYRALKELRKLYEK